MTDKLYATSLLKSPPLTELDSEANTYKLVESVYKTSIVIGDTNGYISRYDVKYTLDDV